MSDRVPAVSILMPARNASAYLSPALNSLKDQVFRNWELIFVDDGSTDDTMRIARSMADERFRFFSSGSTPGLVGALNEGLRHCRASYVARMDADDVALPRRIMRQFRHMEAQRDTVLVGANVRSIDDKGRLISGPWWNLSLPPIRWALLWGNPIAHPTAMFRRDMVGDGYKRGPAEDYRLWVELASKGRLDRLDEVLLYYRIHTDSEMSRRAEIHTKAARDISVVYADSITSTGHANRIHSLLCDAEGDATRPARIRAAAWLRKLIRVGFAKTSLLERAQIFDDCVRRLRSTSAAGSSKRISALNLAAHIDLRFFVAWLVCLIPVLIPAKIASRRSLAMSIRQKGEDR